MNLKWNVILKEFEVNNGGIWNCRPPRWWHLEDNDPPAQQKDTSNVRQKLIMYHSLSPQIKFLRDPRESKRRVKSRSLSATRIGRECGLFSKCHLLRVTRTVLTSARVTPHFIRSTGSFTDAARFQDLLRFHFYPTPVEQIGGFSMIGRRAVDQRMGSDWRSWIPATRVQWQVPTYTRSSPFFQVGPPKRSLTRNIAQVLLHNESWLSFGEKMIMTVLPIIRCIFPLLQRSGRYRY